MRVCSLDPTVADPTAQMSRDELPDTARSSPADETAPATTLQAMPSQWSSIGTLPRVEEPVPTAQTSSAESSATPERLDAPPRFGLRTTVQPWPSKCSVKVRRRLPDLDKDSPTAHTSR